MKIKVNGVEKSIKSSQKFISLNETLKFLGYESNTIIVELNNLIINSDGWKERKIEEGDKLEIVSIVGGG